MASLIFANVLCVLLMALPGAVAKRKGWFSDESVSGLSQFVLRFVYPCIVFASVFQRYGLKELAGGWTLPACAFLMMLAGFAVGLLARLFVKFASKDEERSFLFQCLVNNSSFLPLPLVYALYGDHGAAALFFSILGTETAIWTIGVFTLSGGGFKLEALRNLLSPPLVALYLALGLRAALDATGLYESSFGVQGSFWSQFVNGVKTFGLGTIPLSMTIAGCRISSLRWGSGLANRRVWLLGFLRLAVIPLAFIGLLLVLPVPLETKRILAIVGVMPVSISSCMFCEVYGGDKDFMAGSVLATHIAALASVPLLLAAVLPLFG